MMLTQCPACRTLFRLTGDEQAACGGTVRCGACGSVFQADIYRLDVDTPKVTQTVRRRWPAPTVAGLLTLTLAAQMVFWLRVPLARTAFLHPVATAICRRVSCALPHPLAVRAFRFARLQVTRGAPGGPLDIRATLVNGAAYAQSLPLLVVSLLGPHATRLARHTYPPARYLRHPRTRLGAHRSARVFLRLQKEAAATGYRLTLYPRRR